MIYDREEAIKLLGSLCNDLSLLRSNNYEITIEDFNDPFHKLVFASLQNLSLEKDIIEVDGFQIDSYLRAIPTKHTLFKQSEGVDKIELYRKKAKGCSVEYAYRTVRKFSLLRKFELVGMDISELYDANCVDIIEFEKQRENLDKLSIEQIKNHFKIKLIEIDLMFQTKTDCYSFRAGYDIENLLERCKAGEQWGVGFQSKYYNTVFRGMQLGKFLIRSAGTGGSKTRMSIGDCCNIACSERYIPEIGQWVVNTKPHSVLFVSTELSEDEVNLAMLATVSGVDEEIIKNGNYTDLVEARLKKATLILKNAKIFCEYNSNFSIGDIENTIEKHIIRNEVTHVFFDYMQITSNLAKELSGLFGYSLRDDQALNMLSTALKNICLHHKIFICSSTQLNRSYKVDGYIDATHLRGGMATADKADFVSVVMKATKADIDRLKPILDENFISTPTHAHHIVKNRGGKWVGIIVWTNTSLDTINVEDCFVTTQDFELINSITPTNLI